MTVSDSMSAYGVSMVVEAALAVAETRGISKYSVSMISLSFSGESEESELDIVGIGSNSSVIVVGVESLNGRCDDSSVVALCPVACLGVLVEVGMS